MILRFETDNSHSRVECRRLALGNDYPAALYIADISGPLSACQALAVTLQSDTKARIWIQPEDCDYGGQRLTNAGSGYKVFRHKLDASEWHYVIIAKDPELLPDATEPSLWKALTGPRFTTPLLRQWMPHVRAQLLDQGLLTLLDCRGGGLEPGLLACNDEQLDGIVSSGIIHGNLKIESEAA